MGCWKGIEAPQHPDNCTAPARNMMMNSPETYTVFSTKLLTCSPKKSNVPAPGETVPQTSTMTVPISTSATQPPFAIVSRSFDHLTANIQYTTHAASGVHGASTEKSAANRSTSEWPNSEIELRRACNAFISLSPRGV